jgi:phosphoribosyl-ATP pyrophosphohydrolase/phosphoribosyl-AMP cyclohydrolase
MESAALAWDDRGLLPAVVVDVTSFAPLMLAWVNEEALQKTLESGFAHFFSRSRQKLWKKGESSGHTLKVSDVRVDCDGDALLFVAKPAGPTCHTEKPSCFYTRFSGQKLSLDDLREDEGPSGAKASIIDRLEKVLYSRKNTATAEKSYTRSLLEGGSARIAAKIREESGELIEALDEESTDNVVHETADLLFHMMVGLCARDIPIERVYDELGNRFGVGGHVEKASRSKK